MVDHSQATHIVQGKGTRLDPLKDANVKLPETTTSTMFTFRHHGTEGEEDAIPHPYDASGDLNTNQNEREVDDPFGDIDLNF